MPGTLREPSLQAHSDVSLAMGQPSDAKAAFDVNLRKARVFPVLLQIENRSPSAVSVVRESVKLSGPAGAYRRLTSSEVSERVQYSPAARYFAWSFGLFGIGIIPGIVDHFRAEAANRAIWRDIQEKRLDDAPVGSGRTTRGFVYFDAPTSSDPRQFECTIETSDGNHLQYVLPLPRSD